MVLQHHGELALLTYQLHYAHHEERGPEDQEAANQRCHHPQRLGMAVEATPQLMVLLMLMLMLMLGVLAAALVSHPGASMSDSGDLPLVAAGNPQDVQVDVDEDGEHGEEAQDEDDHSELVDDGEKGTEAVVAVGLHLAHHH